MNRSSAQIDSNDAEERFAAPALKDGKEGRPAHELRVSGSWPAIRLVFWLAALIFVFETVDMFVLPFLAIESNWLVALVDSLLLLVLMTPALYFILFKPMVNYIHRQKEADFTQEAYQRILRISNTSQDLDHLLHRYMEELKRLTECEIVTIRVIDWLGHIKLKSTQSKACLHSDDAHKCMVEKLQGGFCIRIMNELDEQLVEYKTEMGSLYCPEMTRMLATLPKGKVQEIVQVCPLDRFETLALVPMVEKDVRLGFIQLADTRPQAIHPAVLDAVEKSSLQVAAAIQRLRAEDGLRQTKKWLEARVKERTALLTEANLKLNEEIAAQKQLNDEIEGYKRKLQSLSQQVLEEEQQGRKQIATDLHDRIGHNLALIKIKLGMCANQVPTDVAQGPLKAIRELIDQTIADTRTLTFELSPPILYEIGLQSALEWLVQQMEQTHQLKVQVVSHGGEGNLSENQRFVLFRATRELLFNVVKHARADKAMVIIRSDNGEFSLDVEDNGVGFHEADGDADSFESKAFGLFGIRERIGYLGGRLMITNRETGGARVSMHIPVDREENSRRTI